MDSECTIYFSPIYLCYRLTGHPCSKRTPKHPTCQPNNTKNKVFLKTGNDFAPHHNTSELHLFNPLCIFSRPSCADFEDLPVPACRTEQFSHHHLQTWILFLLIDLSDLYQVTRSKQLQAPFWEKRINL